ncbi:sodium- and chloride-dependent taurine transporter-like [Mercenaria mercenaria]|uniref:sodium- and chloride-dependent taurine transporter-like n=1 Tax=Mercenaria mercenaria TaxID=6596 RepID=UPI00234E615C|nr:sodium- and chloride-dependent taurine transporter-like [Mercenaria mercenaria]XP_053386985.1 sodium- and chloride-dependent taurine transporter-like [Mercenaria mercenaria]XP_053386986.1 sodium- and chloride-dependent taurine transporter-like [Mercenaria mercenaria]XP_053386987.1 sodium- and chloride-dependent taurine transporter-like [Mercenaria mercenaria]
MAGEVAPWNLLQIAFIVVYPAWLSFTRMPSGMSLLAAYIFLFVLCVPPVFIQLKIGNHQQKGIVGLLSKHVPILKGVGITLLIQLFLVCVYMVPMVTHYGMYAFIAIAKSPYVWGSCNNAWNTPSCQSHIGVNSGSLLGVVYSTILGNPKTPDQLPESQFFDHEYLQISGNISDVRGFPVWTFSQEVQNFSGSILPLAMVAVWLFIFLALAFGPRVCGWILFVLGPAFLALLFTVLGYGYSHLDSNGSNTFLYDLYNLDMKQFSNLHDENTPLIQDWVTGFRLVMDSVPVWTAILPTMGKMTGNGRLSRNISWLFIILVYAATCQLPQLCMAPYIGNLQQVLPNQILKIAGFEVIFTGMAAAFSKLEIPPVYALLFYLSIFIAGVMFLIVALFTILDNLVEGLADWSETFQERRTCVNFCAGFALISVGVGCSILHTTQAGLYYIIIMDQCTTKLYFLTVALYGFCLIIVYAKQNFGVAERIIMSMWCGVSTIITSAIFLYYFITELSTVPGYNNVLIRGTWDLVCWVLASAPFIAIPAAMIHSCQQENGSFGQKLKYVFCGIKQDPYDPPTEFGYHRPEPSAPPYGTSDARTYTYMDDGYQMDEVPYYKTVD